MIFRSENKLEQGVAIVLIILGVASRLLPHPGNFTAVVAVALFSGVTLSPGLALTVPLIVMAASDLFFEPHSLFLLMWGAFVLTTWIGIRLRGNPKFGRILLGSFAGSLLFYFISNLGVFIFQDMYPKTAAGLVQCYVMALPFLKNSLLANLLYVPALFGAFALAKQLSKSVSFS